ncbi:MAG: holo-ACP synthase [Acidimicrobiales bacterium]
MTAGVIGVGVDVVELDRFRAVLERRPSLVGRLFCRDEQVYAASAADPVPRLAARFAAKEAVMKVLGTGLWSVAFSEIEVVRRRAGVPDLELSGRAGIRARGAGVASWHLSMSHTHRTAIAVAVAEGTAAGRTGRVTRSLPGP